MPLSWIFWLLAAISASQVASAKPVSGSQSTAPSGLETKSPITFPVDINHADLKKLTLLKGLGRKRAQAIIKYRKSHGDFDSINDLANIKGVSKKWLDTLMSKNEGKIVTLH